MSKYSYEFKKTVVLEYLAGSDSGYYQYCRILQLAGAATLVGVTTAIASLIGASFLPNRHSVYAGCGNFAVYRHLVVVRDVDVNHPLKTS